MNATVPTQNQTRNASSSQYVPVRRERGERTFGTGYGNSSGYAAPRGYTGNTGMRTFRFA